MAQSIKVVVNGALGRMGSEVLNALCRHSQLEPVGAVDTMATEDELPLPNHSGSIPFSSDLDSILKLYNPDVLVDFSVAEATLPAVKIAVKHKVNMVIGTTGLSAENIAEIDQLAKDSGIGVIIAPNFALGAVLMIHLAKIAARFFDWAEIVEMHHEKKLDAPSGTALSTARAMLESRGKPFLYSEVQKESLNGTRGGEFEGIALHSMRLPGMMAHQEVILGTDGQTLTIRHDTINRECYMPGVVLAIQKAGEIRGLIYGLDTLLGL